VFPEIAMVLTGQGPVRLVGAALRPVRNFVWRHSEGCVAPGEDIARFIAGTGTAAQKIVAIPNWAPAGLKPQPPEAAAELRRAWALDGKFVVAYSGNLGRVHELKPVIEAATLLRDDAHLAFIFIGSGAQRDAMARIAEARGLTNVQFRPAQPRARLAATLAIGDAHLVTLRPGCESLVFPSKLYGILAVGRPVIFVGPTDCELARLTLRQGFGEVFKGNDPAALADGLRRLAAHPDRIAAMSAKAVEYSRNEGHLEQAVAAWDQLLARKLSC